MACRFSSRREWAIRGVEINLPSLRMAILQLALGALNWSLMAAVIFTLLPSKLDYPLVLGVLLISAIAAIARSTAARNLAIHASSSSRRAQAARQRAAEDREERIRAALEQLPQVQATKRRNGDKAEDARASTTDADARVMKMGDGGFRPAFNVQLATTCQDQVIVGVAVTNVGSDMAQMAPMVEQVIERSGSMPAQWLVDGGFPAHEQIDAVHERTGGKTEVLAPVPEPSGSALMLAGLAAMGFVVRRRR